jgi:hypothetical protein
MRTFYKIAYLTLVWLAVNGCTQEKESHDAGTTAGQHVSNAECTYDSTKFKATIVSVSLDTMMRFQGSPGSTYKVTMVGAKGDSMLLNNMSAKDIDKKFLDDHALKPGSVLEGSILHITSGSCAPVLYRFNDEYLNF